MRRRIPYMVTTVENRKPCMACNNMSMRAQTATHRAFSQILSESDLRLRQQSMRKISQGEKLDLRELLTCSIELGGGADSLQLQGA